MPNTYNSPLERVKTLTYANAMKSGAMKAFEAQLPASAEQQRLMTFGALLFVRNKESCRTFLLKAGKVDAQLMLSGKWQIENRTQALQTCEALANMQVHTPFGDDIYLNVARHGQLDPMTSQDLYNKQGIENAYQHVVKDLARAGKLRDDPPDSPEYKLRVMDTLVVAINTGIECYKTSREMLIDLGYVGSELNVVDTTAAWDLGRVSLVARYGAKAGYLEEADAWRFMQLAADHAAARYTSWKEYLAGYVFGRALAYGNNSLDNYAVMRYLLNGKTSLYGDVSFKG